MRKRLAAAFVLLISEVLIMERNFELVMPRVLKHEGGFVHHPKDPGGATNLGVTIGTARRLGIDIDGDGDTDITDIKLLKPADAAKVYRAEYWNKVRGDDLPAGLDYAVFDFAVNSGPGRAAKYLQAALGVKQDGEIGPVTLGAVAKANHASLIDALCDARLAFMRRAKDRKGNLLWPTFGKGWSSRVAGVRKEALRMAQDAPKPVPAPQQPAQPHSPPAAKPALPIEPGKVIVLPPDNSKLPAKNVLLAFILDVIHAIANLFSRKEKPHVD